MDIQMNELRIVENELGISVDVLVEAIEDALLHAYQRVPGAIRDARVEMDRTSGKVTVWAPEVDEEGNVIGHFDDTPGDFGRIATATAKSIIAQRLRDAESDRVLGSFKGKQGEIVWQFTRPGFANFACLMPGHYEAGMKGLIKVAQK